MGLVYTDVVKNLNEAQKADQDGRIKAREADHFVNKKDGQWEPEIYRLYSNKPRYTIDLTSGVVSDICGELNSMEFDIKIRPSGGESTTDIANHYDGLIRNIENNSAPKAKYTYRAAGKQMITTGIGGWGIRHGYRDPMSFDQDLMIYPISNFMDRVWFDPNAEQQDMSDSNWGFKLTDMSMEAYKKDFPEGSEMSLAHDREHNVYYHKKSDSVVVGQYFYKKSQTVELVRMTNGSIYIVDDKFDSVRDEMFSQGITVDREKKVKVYRVCQQMIDGGGFLNDEEQTVFSYLPIIPCFGNFEISEDKVIYWGVVEKHMDPQRILNYAESRKIAEGALAPRAKKWMTPQQAAGHEATLRTQNTNDDPIQLYNFIDGQPIPFETGGAQINQGLLETTGAMNQYMQSISGRMNPSRNESQGLQSGVALQMLQNKGDNANYGYFNSMEIAIEHTAKVLVDAIPRVYDAMREIQLDFQDGTNKTITINQRVFDQQTGEVVELNDLSKGVYSVSCSAGAAFHNRQQETIAAINEIATIDPSILQTGGDIYLNNIPAPGMDKIAKRKRAQMLEQGLIPVEEMTDEEQQKMQAQQQEGQQPSPMDQAMLITAQAEAEKAQAETADVISKTQEREMKMVMEAEKLRQQEQQNQANEMFEMIKLQNEQTQQLAETLKTIKEAMGADAILNPETARAYDEQSKNLLNATTNAR